MIAPGSVSISRLKVYDSVAPDGQCGGTPHVHLLCSEMYVTLAGQGAVEIIDASGFSRVELRPFDTLIFNPGTIHRLINQDGALELLVIMQHNGLPESGDNVVCFSDAWLDDAEAFAEAMHVTTLEEAYQRRDRGVAGFLRLKTAFTANPSVAQAGLHRFYQLAIERTAPFRPDWADVLWREAEVAEDAANRLNALRLGNIADLLAAQHQWIAGGEPNRLGFCGHLHRYALEGTQVS